MVQLPVYLDNHATTRIDPRVLTMMMPYLKDAFGNPSSRHHPFGRRAGEAVETAREKIAAGIHAVDAEEIIFTSGTTESNNLAVKGAAEKYRGRGNHLITTSIEHKSVSESCRYLETHGFQVTYLPVGRDGRIRLDELRAAVTDKTILISVMAANNEIGVTQPIAEIGRIAKEKNILFHCDAAQAVCKIPLDVEALGIDLLSFSAHKLYGPKGVGALYVRKRHPRVRLASLLHGGGHEQGLRSGTLPVAEIAGFGAAVEMGIKEMKEEAGRLLALREKLRQGIEKELDAVFVNGSLEHRLPGNLNMSFKFVEGESLLMGLNEEVAVSSGSACASTSMEPSSVLKALGIDEDLIHTSVRFGLGRFNTEAEIDHTIHCVNRVVRRLRSLSPLYRIYQEERKSADTAAPY